MSEADLLVRVRRRLATETGVPTAAQIAAAVRAEGGLTGTDRGLELLQSLQDDLLGAGPLAPLLRDPTVTDVLVNAPDEVWVDRGHGLEPAGVRFADDEEVRRLVARLLLPSGRRLDQAQPWVDARLPDGTRLHAVLPPISRRATTVSLRTLGRQSFTLDDLVERGSVEPAIAAALSAIVAARLSALVTGGTGTGKTTLLACLLGLADPRDRVVVVEDAAELRPACPHVVCLEARPPNVDGAGEVTMRDLVRQAMRMRPDRIVVGEVRGAEVVEMLAALNTGHEGGLSTVHANATADVPARLEALAGAAGLARDALHSQVAAGVQTVIHLRRDPDGVRRVAEVAVVCRAPAGAVDVTSAVSAVRRGGTSRGPAWDALAAMTATRGVPLPGGC
ncbi:MAG TPA: TadA family conjugal transfer-associated ATPase [Mycobacteriales bacterium]|nr:TadA family conjugal transfer-associated ATPase [Mycobacteriales bacterium]